MLWRKMRAQTILRSYGLFWPFSKSKAIGRICEHERGKNADDIKIHRRIRHGSGSLQFASTIDGAHPKLGYVNDSWLIIEDKGGAI